MQTVIKAVIAIAGLYYIGTTFIAIKAGEKTTQNFTDEIVGMAQWLLNMARQLFDAVAKNL